MSRPKGKRRRKPPKAGIRPHDWLSPSERGTTHLPDTLRREIGDPKMIPWIPDANLVVLYNPDITLEEIEMGLDIMKMDVRLRYKGKTEDEITTVLSDLRDLLRSRDYKALAGIIRKMKEENDIEQEAELAV